MTMRKYSNTVEQFGYFLEFTQPKQIMSVYNVVPEPICSCHVGIVSLGLTIANHSRGEDLRVAR